MGLLGLLSNSKILQVETIGIETSKNKITDFGLHQFLMKNITSSIVKWMKQENRNSLVKMIDHVF